MKRTIALGLLLVLGAVLITGCVHKEIMASKIELGSRQKPKPHPDLDRVKKNLNKAKKLYPNEAEVFYLLGRVNLLERDYPEMDKNFKKSEELSPKFKPDIDTLRATAWKELVDSAAAGIKANDFAKALKFFKLSTICWPYRFEPYFYGADAARRLDKKEESLELAKKAYEIAPDSLRVIKLYADLLLLNYKNDEAFSLYNKLIEKDPTNSNVIFQLADLYRTKGDIDKAIEYFKKGLELENTNSDAWFNLGLIYFQQKNFCKAAESFKHVVTLIPEDTDVKVNYLLSLVQCGELEAAKGELETFTTEHPEKCEGWDLLSQTYLRLKMKKEAAAAYQKYQDCSKKDEK